MKNIMYSTGAIVLLTSLVRFARHSMTTVVTTTLNAYTAFVSTTIVMIRILRNTRAFAR